MTRPIAPAAEVRLVYRSGRDGLIRGLNLFSLAFLGLMSFLASLPTGTHPGDPQTPLGMALFRAAIVAVGLIFPLAMWAYGRRYVSTLALDRTGTTAIARMVGFLWPHERRIPLDRFGAARWNEGRFEGAIRVNAPWTSIPVRDGPGLIVDAQGDVLDETVFDELLARAAGR